MKLRAKLLFAQLPLALALALVGVLSVRTTRSLAGGAQAILQDNYRSVLAAQRMKEAVERLDSAAVFLALGEDVRARAQAAENRPRFEAELQVQEHNLTELGEPEATQRLRALWTQYLVEFDAYFALPERAGLGPRYFGRLQPKFAQVKDAADEILVLNQDAMVRKSDLAQAQARNVDTILVLATLAALLAGAMASFSLTSRLLRPLSVLAQASRRLGEGDLAARARVSGRDEVAALATEFNTMAERMGQYRQSSLGELLQAQNAAQAAIDALPDAVVVFDRDGAVLAVNRAAESDFRVRLETAQPLLSAEPAVRETLERIRDHVLGGKGAYVPQGFEEAFSASFPDGERWLLPRATPVRDDAGAVIGLAAVLQDVTRLRRFNELKDDLVATVAHEFRTPLTSLRMAIHLCLEEAAGPLSAKQADLLGAAREDCERLQKIVDDLLDLSRLQAGRQELARAETAVEALLTLAHENARSLLESRGMKLELEDLAPGARVDVDPERLELVLTNLLANAVRHSPPGEAIVLRARAIPGGMRFEVADRGPGVPAAFRERIFEKFFRVPGQPGGGAGLGLYIAREIIVAHGGSIGVESSEGGGSTFWFELPARRSG